MCRRKPLSFSLTSVLMSVVGRFIRSERLCAMPSDSRTVSHSTNAGGGNFGNETENRRKPEHHHRTVRTAGTWMIFLGAPFLKDR